MVEDSAVEDEQGIGVDPRFIYAHLSDFDG